MITVLSWPANLVALPDQIAELDFLTGLVGKPSSVRPDFAEDARGHGRLDDLLVRVAKTVFLPKSGFARRMRSCVFNAPSL
jgi:hypothetical protein